MANEQAKFLNGSLLKHVTVMSLTASIGLMAIFAVDFIDMIFISMLGKAELAAAVGYAGAILFFTSSFGIGMAIAAGALVARALGEGETHKASRRAATALMYGVGLGSIFAAVVWLNLRPLAQFVGAQGETLDLSVRYMQIIVPSLPFLIAGMIGGAILRAHGAARASMMATLWGGIVNAVLDPIFIFGLGLDLTGAAMASVAARIAICVFSLRPIFRDFGGLDKPTPEEFKQDLPVLAAIAAPAILTQLATPIGQAYVTRAMAEFGEVAVAGMAVVGRMTPMAFGVIFALSGAIGPIIGQNFGAQKFDRVRQTFVDSLIFVGVTVTLISGLLFLLRPVIADVFALEGIALQLVFLFCGPLSLLFFFNGMLFVSNASFNNLGHPFYSTWMNWGLNSVVLMPLVWLGAQSFGAVGVLVGQACAAVLVALVSLGLTVRIVRKMEEGADGHDRPHFHRQGRLLSLHNLRR